MTINVVDASIIVIYMLFLLGLGYYASRKIKGMEDYTVAGRKLGYPVLLGTLIGTAIGAGSTIGQTGKAYTFGIAFVVVAVSYGIGLILFGFIAPIIRRTKIWTVPDALVLRYGNSMRLITAVLIFLAVIALYGAHLIAMGLAVKTILGDFGITFNEAVLVAGGIMVLYTIMGGLVAVAYTDFIQTIIMIIGVGIMLPIFIINDVGGLSAAWEHIRPEPGNFLGGLSPVYIVSIWIIYICFNLIDPSLLQRASAAKDAKTVRKSMFITGGIYFCWCIVGAFLGAMAAYLFPELAGAKGGPDSAVPMEIAHHLPIIIKGLCLSAIMAAIMSTADTALLIAGTTFSHNIVGAFRPQTKDRTLLILSRLCIFVIGVLGIVIAMTMKGVFNIMMLSFAIFVAGIFVPTMAALFWKKATKAGALISSSVAAVAVVTLTFLKIAKKLPGYIEPIVVAIILSLILMVIVSLVTYKSDRETTRLIDLEVEEES